MKKKFLSTQYVIPCLLIYSLLVLVLGCKKETESSAKNSMVNAAKSWYQSNQVKNITVNTVSASMPLRFAPEWDSAEAHMEGDTSFIAVPVVTNLTKAFGEATKFTLLIKTSNFFEAKVVAVKRIESATSIISGAKTLYYAAFTNEDLSKELPVNTQIMVFDQQFRSKELVQYLAGGKKVTAIKSPSTLMEGKSSNGALTLPRQNLLLKMKEPSEGCTEMTWWLVYSEFEDGILVYQEILGQLPSTWSCDGGGETSSPEPMPDLTAREFYETGHDFSTTPINSPGEKRTWPYNWEVARGKHYDWSVMSHEVGTHKKINGKWEWEKLEHINFSVDNKPFWLNVEVTLLGNAIPFYYSKTQACLYIQLGLNTSVLYKGSPIGPSSKNLARYSPMWVI